MIYTSTSCIKTRNISDAVGQLVAHGIKNIELSGGTEYDPEILNKLKSLKDEFDINFMVHNYFPPPREAFVLNLASLNDDVYSKSLEHFKKAIDMSIELGADAYGMHAGFYINITTDQLGKRIRNSQLFDKQESMDRFCCGFNELKSFAGDISLYLENNVFSYENAQEYQESVPLMMTCYSEYLDLKKLIDFNLLLDVAHLKVSAHTLGLDFNSELTHMANHSDYWHLSDNNNLADQNNSISEEFLLQLAGLPNQPKKATIEVYDDIDVVVKNYSNVCEIID